jgi:hypothetical protein
LSQCREESLVLDLRRKEGLLESEVRRVKGDFMQYIKLRDNYL